MGECTLPDHDCIRQRVRAIRSGVIDSCACREQDLRRLDVTILRGTHQRRERLLRSGMDVAPLGEERAHYVHMAFGDRPHQRRFVRSGGGGVDVGATGQQGLHNIQVARARGHHERRQSVRLGRIWIRPGLEQAVDRQLPRVFARPREGRHAMVVGRIHVGAGAQQQLDRVTIVPVRRPEERRRAVGPRDVDIDALFEQRPRESGVSLGERVHQSDVWGGSRCDADHQREEDKTQADKLPRAGAHAGPPRMSRL